MSAGSSSGGGSIGRITTGGAIMAYADSTVAGPLGIAVGSDGALWFTNDFSVGRITKAGTISNFPDTDGSAGWITAGPDNALWLTTGDGSIVRLTTNGKLKTYGARSVSGPEGITAGSDGALWFTNSGNDSIG
jgi:virginiamycin B lyase